MFNFLFEKFNNFIQWTKKWYWTHIIVIGTVFSSILGEIYNIFWSIINKSLFTSDTLETMLITPYMIINFLIPASLLISLLAMIIQKFRGKPMYVTNDFLLNNSKYNLFYIITSIIIILYTCTITIATIFLLYFLLLYIGLILFLPIYNISINLLEDRYNTFFKNISIIYLISLIWSFYRIFGNLEDTSLVPFLVAIYILISYLIYLAIEIFQKKKNI